MTPSEFHEINWLASLDVEQHLAAVPVGATIKTIYLRDLIAQAMRAHVRLEVDESLLGQRDCSLRSYMRHLCDASRVMYPGLSTRSALRQLGRSVFPTFVDSLVGRAMMGVMGNDVVSIMKLANRAAAAAISIGHVATLKAEAGEALLHYRRVYFTDTYQIGVVEGMLFATKKRGASIRLQAKEVDDVYLQIAWSESKGVSRAEAPRGA